LYIFTLPVFSPLLSSLGEPTNNLFPALEIKTDSPQELPYLSPSIFTSMGCQEDEV
jgi:hypothetical protein